MDINTILTVIQIVLYVILGGLAYWYNKNAKIQEKVRELINTAEGMYVDTTKAGGKRFDWVVDSLYLLLPSKVRDLIPRTWIEVIVQKAFDEMKDFAQKNLDTAVEKVFKENENGGELDG